MDFKENGIWGCGLDDSWQTVVNTATNLQVQKMRRISCLTDETLCYLGEICPVDLVGLLCDPETSSLAQYNNNNNKTIT
jgi:hypothetical protein